MKTRQSKAKTRESKGKVQTFSHEDGVSNDLRRLQRSCLQGVVQMQILRWQVDVSSYVIAAFP
jgi:hypothetical protein